MEHLGIPLACRSQAIPVPYLGTAPKYDREGLMGFPERHGLKTEELTKATKQSLAAPATNPKGLTPEFVESFLQEWLWFGALQEFEIACGLPMDMGDYLRYDAALGGRVLDTSPLLLYVRAVVIGMLSREGVPLDLKVGDVVQRRMFFGGFSVPLGTYKVERDLGDLKYMLNDSKEEMVIHLVRKGEPLTSGNTSRAGNLPGISLRTLAHGLRVLRFHNARDTRDILGQEQNNSQLAECLRHIRTTMRVALLENDPILRTAIAFSIDVLCESLGGVVDAIFPGKVRLGSASSIYLVEISQHLQLFNWCPARVERSLTDQLIPMYWIASLSSGETKSHQNCNTISCSYNATNTNQFSLKHSSGYCNGSCPKVTIPETKLVNILKTGGIPGISSVFFTSEAGISFEIVDVKHRPYIAISHVWSHGLGNPTSNSLPLCQVLTLFKYIQALGPPNVDLWVDTLVVPIEPKYKLMAIMRLRAVYKNAFRVLVIDKHLSEVGNHWLEQRMQLLASEWMKRLWTLQEGLLAAGRLWIQYKYQPVSIHDLTDTEIKNAPRFDPFIFHDMWMSTGKDVSLLFGERGDASQRFVDLMPNISNRSVTVPTDEPICLATLLGLSLEQIQGTPTMIDIYRLLPNLPENLPFYPSPRIQQKGFRWAPASFLGQGPIFTRDNLKHAELSAMGINVQKDAIFFDTALNFREDLVRDSIGAIGNPYLDVARIHIVRVNGEMTFGFRMQGSSSYPIIFHSN
jgi:hypothetical protein